MGNEVQLINIDLETKAKIQTSSSAQEHLRAADLKYGYDHILPAQICMAAALILPLCAGLMPQEVAVLCCKPQPLLHAPGPSLADEALLAAVVPHTASTTHAASVCRTLLSPRFLAFNSGVQALERLSVAVLSHKA